MEELWRGKVIVNGSVYREDRTSRDAAKAWVSEKFAELGHPVSIEWSDRGSSSASAPAPGLEAHVSLRQ